MIRPRDSSPDPRPRWRQGLEGLTRRFSGPPKVAFVLSGGGNLGAIQAGMLRALVEAGVRPDLVVGCSVGAINGAAFAAEPDHRGVERLDRIWTRLAEGRPDLMPSGFIPVAAQLARKGESLHDREVLAALLDEELPVKTFERLEIPFSCVAADLDTAAETWFDSGRLVPALLASAALPAVYPAFERGGRAYIDGGVLNEVHTQRAMQLGATELYVLHVGHLEGRSQEVERPFDAATRAYWTARRYRLEDDLARVPPDCVVHRLPAGSRPRLRFDDFAHGPELAGSAYDASSRYLTTGEIPEPVEGPTSERRFRSDSRSDESVEPEPETEGMDPVDSDSFDPDASDWDPLSPDDPDSPDDPGRDTADGQTGQRIGEGIDEAGTMTGGGQ